MVVAGLLHDVLERRRPRNEHGRQLSLDAELSGPSVRPTVGLLQHAASGRCPSLGDVPDELRLSRGEVGDPVDIAGSGTALDGAGDCLQRLLIARQGGLARLLGRLDNPLVELANTLRGRLETGLG